MRPLRTTTASVLSGILVLVIAVAATGNPVMIPASQVPRSAPPERFSVRYQHVDVTIEDQAATTVIDQVFVNNNAFVVEGTYLFPIPESASITDFAMWMNGEKITGELLEAEEARRTYENIVRSMRDPGLLEHAGRDVYRARVFPIPAKGEVRVEMSYQELLTYESGLVTYRYPLNTERFVPKPLEEVSVSVSIKSSIDIKSLMSPSHAIDPIVAGSTATCGYEDSNVVPDRDFFLYYTVSEEDVGLNLVTHRIDGDDGYFMLLLSPGRLEDPDKVIPKDIVFVLDRSGSMRGEKLEQAKSALAFCLENLNPDDRFRLLTFATQLRVFGEELLPVTDETIADALVFVEEIEAGGSTDIDLALSEALSIPPTDRPHIVIFLTDGLPTTGVTKVGKILENARARNVARARVFPFGVGYNVNVMLLDRLSLDHRGSVEYVRPSESVEHKVTSFYSRVRSPVLSDISIEFDDVTVYDTYPFDLPDVFDGTQAVIFGRYEGAGKSAVRLRGHVEDREEEFVYAASFPAETDGRAFIPPLWASRKIAYLITAIRLNGEDPELRSEVVRLATDHGLVTEYTSYLVMEGTRVSSAPPPTRFSSPPATDPSMMAGTSIPMQEVQIMASRPVIDTEVTATRTSAPKVRPINTVEEAIATQPGVVLHEGEIHVRGGRASPGTGSTAQTGRSAVEASRQLAAGRRAMAAVPDPDSVRHVGDKLFRHDAASDGWIDADCEEDADVVEIEFLSDEYFELLDRDPEIGKYLALGERVTFVFEGTTYRVVTPEESTDE